MGHVGHMNHQVGHEIVHYQANKRVGSRSKKRVEPMKRSDKEE